MFLRLTNYRSVVFNTHMTTKEEIINALLSLGEEKGLANVSLADIALEVGIRKASIYSHFESQQALTDAAMSYCAQLLSQREFTVDFKAPDAGSLIYSLADSFLQTFTEAPLSSYYSIIHQQMLFDPAFSSLNDRLESMLTARVRVALEFCVQRGWLDIPDTDIAADFFSGALTDALRTTLSGESDYSLRLERLTEGLVSLFS